MAETWWWDLGKGRAVTSEERPRDVEVLGPYPSRAAAEAWRETAEARNEAWDEADEEWEGTDDDDETT